MSLVEPFAYKVKQPYAYQLMQGIFKVEPR